jgi:nucleoside-diphosphate kinase
MEKTIVMLKPDGLALSLGDTMIERLCEKDLHLLSADLVMLTDEAIRKLYKKYVNQWFFPYILDYLQEGPCLLTVWEGEDCYEKCREVKGNSYKGTGMRGEWSSCEVTSEEGETSYIKNVLHVSDPEDFEREYEILSNFIIPYEKDERGN